jgi:chorismate--pyruvate lyase
MLQIHPHPVNATLRAWLQAPGSLTARLRSRGTVQVVVLRQSTQTLWQMERDDLQSSVGHVREVALLVNGVPAVWARSATSQTAIKGPWKALVNLGSRPLAELLFQGRHITRDPLQSHHIRRHGPLECHLRSAWAGLHHEFKDNDLPRWARSSVFWHGQQPLRVMEAFAPWIAQRP